MIQPQPALQPNLGGRSGTYLPTLDGWRAVAIVMVLISHSIPFGAGRWVNRYMLGSMGVHIFFGLSGFLICTRLLEEWKEKGRIHLASFYLRRACRILPAAYAFLLVLAGLNALGQVPVSVRDLLGSAFFFRNYLPEDSSGIHYFTGHFWSLAVEEHFYLVFPFLLALSRCRHAARWILFLGLATATWRIADSRMGWVASLLPNLFPPFRTDYCFEFLLAGCWMAALMDCLRPRLASLPLQAAGLVAGTLMLCSLIGWLKIPLILETFALPVMLAATVLRPASLPGRILELSPFRWLGRISYSVYLYQQLFFVAARKNQVPGLQCWQEWPLNLVAVLACAMLSYYLLERPCMALGRRLAVKLG